MEYEITISKDEFLNFTTSQYKEFCKDKKHTAKIISEFVVKNSLSLKSVETLTKMSKDNIRKDVLEGLEPQVKNSGKTVKSGSDNFASDIVEVLDGLKMEIQNKHLNKFVKSLATKSLDSLISKFDSEEKLQNLGMIGNIVVMLFTVLDVFIDIKTIPTKIKEFKEKRALANANAE